MVQHIIHNGHGGRKAYEKCRIDTMLNACLYNLTPRDLGLMQPHRTVHILKMTSQSFENNLETQSTDRLQPWESRVIAPNQFL